MSYRAATAFLAKHTNVVELTGGGDARVAICPAYQGRVMTSSCGGVDGASFGFVCTDFIEAARHDPHFNNYGGEERMWLSPEGGQFSLWFEPGAEQNIGNWFTPPALNEGVWKVVSSANDHCRMTTAMKLQNASGADLRLDVTRDVRLLRADDLKELFGEAVAETLGTGNVRMVAYETRNKITNRGKPMTKATGLVSIWILSMLNAGPETVTIVPYKPGEEAVLGPVVKSDYFGEVPPQRLKIIPEAVLFRADAEYRSKIGTSQRRARNVLGSFDFRGDVLTIAQFTMPNDPTGHHYMNSMWELPQAEPYIGDVVNAYNDGPNAAGGQLGAFYEIESVSPAKELGAGESLVHCHRTIHIQGDRPTLRKLAQETLGVELETVHKAMISK